MKRTKKYASISWVSATTKLVLIVRQPYIPVCIGNLATTTSSLIGKHTCTRLYYDWLLFSLHLQSDSTPSKSHPLTTTVHNPLPYRGILIRSLTLAHLTSISITLGMQGLLALQLSMSFLCLLDFRGHNLGTVSTF